MKTEKSTDVVFGHINLGGVGFAINSELKKHKVYDLKLKAQLPDKDVEVSLKITPVEMGEKGGEGYYFCRAVYRNLTNEQVAVLKEIANYFEGKDGKIYRPWRLAGSIERQENHL